MNAETIRPAKHRQDTPPVSECSETLDWDEPGAK
jgi:hypothetical protein